MCAVPYDDILLNTDKEAIVKLTISVAQRAIWGCPVSAVVGTQARLGETGSILVPGSM